MTDRTLFLICLVSAAFWIGFEVGHEQSSIDLEPCPKYDGKSVAYTVDDLKMRTRTCAYIKSYGKAIKRERV